MGFDVEKFAEYIEPIIIKTMTSQHIPGMAVVAFNADSILYQRGFGHRDLERYLPFTPDTLNGFGSCTKAFTAIAVLQLQEQGRISIEDPLSKYIPFKLGDEDNPIRIKHALSHTSGLPSLGMATVSFVSDLDSKVPSIPLGTWEDVFDFVNDAGNWISDKPGTVWHYNNTMYTLIGYIIEQITGMQFAEYIVKHILKPLNMHRSHFERDVVLLDDNLSVAYTGTKNSDGQMRPIPGAFPFDRFIHPPGGLISSCMEMVQFIHLLMNKGKTSESQIFNKESYQLLTTPQYEVPIRDLSLPSVMGYALGLGIYDDFLGDRVIRHTGGITGGFSMMAFLEKQQVGIIAISNYPQPPFDEILKGFALLLGREVKDHFNMDNPYSHLNDLVGKYYMYKGINTVEIMNRGNILILEMEDNEIPLHSTDDPYVFEFHQGNWRFPVKFEKIEDVWEFTVERNKFKKS